LIEASVWIAPEISNWVSDWTARSVAETTPTESDCCSPKGLPIAATGWPTRRSRSSPSFSGCSSKPSGSIRSGGDHVAIRELDVDLVRLHAVAARFVGDDVGVGDDFAVVVEDEAGAFRALLAEDRADRHHSGRCLFVDAGGVEARARGLDRDFRFGGG
jgi:hypothetical protein